jgi:hypothetical protein
VVHWHQCSRALWDRQGRACLSASVHVCVLCTVTEKGYCLGPFRWRDKDEANGSAITAEKGGGGA